MPTEAFDKENPDPEKLADDDDELGWDVNKHGRMKDHGMPDEFVPTVPWEDEED